MKGRGELGRRGRQKTWAREERGRGRQGRKEWGEEGRKEREEKRRGKRKGKGKTA